MLIYLLNTIGIYNIIFFKYKYYIMYYIVGILYRLNLILTLSLNA